MEIEIKAKLVMWEKSIMPDRKYNPDTKEWIKTGVEIEKTIYTFRDDWGHTLKLYGDNGYREYESKDVIIKGELSQREFQGKTTTRVKLLDVVAL